MSLEYRVGDVFDRLAEIPDGSIDLIVTSPPFLALRSYLPADHEHKAKEIGSESTPAAFIDTLLALTAEFGRILAPHGSLCVELGDTFSGGSTATMVAQDRPQDGGYDYMDAARVKRPGFGHNSITGIRNMDDKHQGGGPGWPLAKSLTGIPQAYMLSLAYGRNVLTGQPSPAGQYRIRNQIVWARPNPPVGALGDKFRPATSYITVACRGVRRFFDLDAVRGPISEWTEGYADRMPISKRCVDSTQQADAVRVSTNGDGVHQQGAPPLDWHTDNHPQDGDWLWKLSTQPYKGAHYATFPLELPTRLIRAMCPQRVCTVCGKPSERIVGKTEAYESFRSVKANLSDHTDQIAARHLADKGGVGSLDNGDDAGARGQLYETVGWTDCECDERQPTWNQATTVSARTTAPTTLLTKATDAAVAPLPPTSTQGVTATKWRTGTVLDPFAGSGTTLQAAQNVGRHAIGIDLDETNADLARARVGMFMTVTP